MNEVKIVVRVQNSGKAGLQAVDKDVDEYADKFARTFASRLQEALTRNLTTQLLQRVRAIGDQAQASASAAGDRIGDTIGRRASDRIMDRITNRLRDSRGRFLPTNGAGSGGLDDDHRVKVQVDVDKQSFLQRLAGLGKSAGSLIATGVGGALTTLFSGDIISLVAKMIVGALVAAFGSSVVGAAISSMILLALGGGAIAIGIAGAIKDPRIQTAIDGIGERLKVMADKFSAHFKGPLEDFFAPGNKGGGGLIGVIEQITPMVEQLGRVLGPVAGKLGDGIIGMLQNMLPPLLRAMEKSAPVIEKLAEKLPGLGASIGKFFETIADGSPEAALFLGDLLEAFGWLIESIGQVIKNLTFLYGFFRTCIVGMINLMGDFLRGAVIAFGWIPGVGPKLKGLEAKFAEFRRNANNQLNGIRDRTVDIRIRVLGMAAARAALSVANSLAAMGYAHGGIKGAADGGMKSGLSWVGEHGPELVKLPPGAQVHSAGDSQRMAAGGGGKVDVTVRPVSSRAGSRELFDVILRDLRWEIANFYGGDTQLALGQG